MLLQLSSQLNLRKAAFFASTKNLKTFESNQEKSNCVTTFESIEDVQLEIDSVLECDIGNTIVSVSSLQEWLKDRMIWKPIFLILLIQQIGNWVKNGNISLHPLVTAVYHTVIFYSFFIKIQN